MTHFQNNIVPNRLLKSGDHKTTLFLKQSIEILKSLYPQDNTFLCVKHIMTNSSNNDNNTLFNNIGLQTAEILWLKPVFYNSKLMISLDLFLE